MSKRFLTNIFVLSTFSIFITNCSAPQQNMLRQKWYLTAVSVCHTDEGSLMDNDSTSRTSAPTGKVICDTVRTEGSTDFFDFSDSKNYSAQLMGSSSNGTYLYNQAVKQIIRHSSTTGSIDTIEIKKLTKDTLELYEKNNMLTMLLVAKKQ